MLTHWAFSNGWEPSPISANSQVPQTFSLSGIGVLHCFEDIFVKCGDFRAGFTSRLKLLDPEPGVVGMREGNTVSDVARGTRYIVNMKSRSRLFCEHTVMGHAVGNDPSGCFCEVDDV